MSRYPVKDQVAIVGLGSTGFARDLDGRSELSLATEASIAAIHDAGLVRGDVDGVVGTAIPAHRMVETLGLDDVTWFANAVIPVGFALVNAMHAIHAGLCETVLLYHSLYRTPYVSRAAARDPFRRQAPSAFAPPPGRNDPDTIDGVGAYAAWASRYLHEYGVGREAFGRIAINDRSNASRNPLAAKRELIDMDDYLAARMIREPLAMLDMDVPVDGADAFVLTTAERARDLARPSVLLHAACAGIANPPGEDRIQGLHRHGQHVVVDFLRRNGDFWIDDVDVYYPYDGFTILTLAWLENSGWCGPGEAHDFVQQHWDAATNRILIEGRVPVNTHGGSLSEGATQGSGHVREAVTQLRGDAGDRQVPGAQRALVTPGGFFFNSQGVLLRRD
jgi:acetyl-CoA acetyltransferase